MVISLWGDYGFGCVGVFVCAYIFLPVHSWHTRPISVMFFCSFMTAAIGPLGTVGYFIFMFYTVFDFLISHSRCCKEMIQLHYAIPCSWLEEKTEMFGFI